MAIIKTLAICVPSYNRKKQIQVLLNSILSCDSDDFEVVILDNGSTDGTIEYLQKINDCRIKVFQNEYNIGGVKNIVKCLTMSNEAKYSMLCLDKDKIIGNYLNLFIEQIRDADISLGYCSLNNKETKQAYFQKKGYDALSQMGCLSSHPSGRFYKTEIYKNIDIVKHYLDSENLSFPFCLDVINAYISMTGDSMIYNGVLVRTETIDECSKIKSYTYNEESKIYFYPINRAMEYTVYINTILELELNKREKLKILLSIYKRGLLSATFGFKNAIENEPICIHHNIKCRNVGMKELLSAFMNYHKYLYTHAEINILLKIFLIIASSLTFSILCLHILFKTLR